jgi:hypothetical protein
LKLRNSKDDLCKTGGNKRLNIDQAHRNGHRKGTDLGQGNWQRLEEGKHFEECQPTGRRFKKENYYD